MINLVINRETGTLDVYDRSGSRLFRSFATVEAAKKGLPLLGRGRHVAAMVAKYEKYLKAPSAAKSSVAGIDFSKISKVSDLPAGFVIPDQYGSGKPYIVGQKRGRPAGFAVKWLAEQKQACR